MGELDCRVDDVSHRQSRSPRQIKVLLLELYICPGDQGSPYATVVVVD